MPITEIPEHIRNLPLEEQGPTLVQDIHDRKAIDQLRAEMRTEMLEAMREQFQMGATAGVQSLWSAITSYAAHLPSNSPLLPGLHATMLMLEEIKKEVLNVEP